MIPDRFVFEMHIAGTVGPGEPRGRHDERIWSTFATRQKR